MVRPDLRRDMVGVPEIVLQESRCGTPRRNIFITGVHSPREPSSQGWEQAET
jgi:hypothetical protein